MFGTVKIISDDHDRKKNNQEQYLDILTCHLLFKDRLFLFERKLNSNFKNKWYLKKKVFRKY